MNTPAARLRTTVLVLGGAALAALAGPAMADGPAAARQTPPLWEAGVFFGAAIQPAYPGAADDTSRALPLPYLIYRGPVLRVDEGSAALRALRTPRFELSVGVGGSLGSSSKDVEARAGMPDLGTLIEAGPRLVWNLADPGPRGRAPWRLEVPLRAVLDLNDALRYRGLVFAPELVHERALPGAWRMGARFGPVFGDERLADLFYGVDPVYATPTRPAYDARAGLIAWRAGASLSRSFGPDLSLFLFLRVDSLAGAANRDSPLVERDAGVTGGIGLAWSFARSSRPASD
jgi:outer membrane scaffolding protein for murein synthesis (MipA/OmpV family)